MSIVVAQGVLLSSPGDDDEEIPLTLHARSIIINLFIRVERRQGETMFELGIVGDEICARSFIVYQTSLRKMYF